jgi:hypothetical protein
MRIQEEQGQQDSTANWNRVAPPRTKVGPPPSEDQFVDNATPDISQFQRAAAKQQS